jgi:hypothetical protein
MINRQGILFAEKPESLIDSPLRVVSQWLLVKSAEASTESLDNPRL